jgi:hypothetical protein
MKIGDIVYRTRKGGFIHDEPVAIKDRIGLIIKDHREKGAVPQYYVQFDQDVPKWYYKHDLRTVGGERK